MISGSKSSTSMKSGSECLSSPPSQSEPVTPRKEPVNCMAFDTPFSVEMPGQIFDQPQVEHDGLPRPKKLKLNDRVAVSVRPEVCSLEGRPLSTLEINTAIASHLKLSYGEAIAIGTYGQVSQWTDSDGRKVAVKVFGRHENRRWQSMEKGEINALFVDEHPYIVRTYKMLAYNRETGAFSVIEPGISLPRSVTKDHEVQAVVCEFIDGPDLWEATLGDTDKETQPLEDFKPCAGVAERLGPQISSALNFLHKSGFIYRDLKPENFLVDKKTGSVKLIDFGFTKWLDKNQTTKTFCGTFDYLAPEVVTNSGKKEEELGEYGPKADAWSLGALLLNLAVGGSITPANLTDHEVKFSDNRKESLDIILNFAKKPCSEKKAYFQRNFDGTFKNHERLLDIITKLLERDPEKRMSVEDAFKALTEIQKPLAVSDELGLPARGRRGSV